MKYKKETTIVLIILITLLLMYIAALGFTGAYGYVGAIMAISGGYMRYSANKDEWDSKDYRNENGRLSYREHRIKTIGIKFRKFVGLILLILGILFLLTTLAE